MSIQILEWISNIRGRPNVTKPNSTCHNDKTKSPKINRGHYYNETLILSLIIDKFYLKSFSLLLQIKKRVSSFLQNISKWKILCGKGIASV